MSRDSDVAKPFDRNVVDGGHFSFLVDSHFRVTLFMPARKQGANPSKGSRRIRAGVGRELAEFERSQIPHRTEGTKASIDGVALAQP